MNTFNPSPFGIKKSSLIFLLLASRLSAVNIVLAYENEADFFKGNLIAKAAVEQAAADISNVLTNSLSPLITDTYTGAAGTSSLTVDWLFSYTQPSTGDTVVLQTPHISPGFGTDQIIINVGMRNLSGTTLGQGGPGGAGGGFGGVAGTDFAQAVDNMEALSAAAMLRGSGPVISTLAGNIGGEDYALSYGMFLGNLWFDSDTNDDSVTDTEAELGMSWHFDHTSAVGGSLSDL